MISPLLSLRTSRMIAPLACLALLAGIAAEARQRPAARDAEPFHARVRQACAAVPESFGDWRSVEDSMPSDVANLLRPNAWSSRTFTNARTCESVNVNIVQCRDARDMTGHFPPLCFASNGWIERSSEDGDLQTGAGPVPVRVYVFSRPDAQEREGLAVVHFIALPARGFERDLNAIWSAAGDYTRRHFGAAQFQLVFLASLDPVRRIEIAREFIDAHRELINALTTCPEAGATAGHP